ncbi:cell division protein FtsL [Litorivicinus lipolyticus]|uniref:Cell division protein FtsL n=1 Tax=Litorivicinus lipolyticus TaxID=418701 RepID=A0A5Q2QF11_9GAMM|nr:cell division protein FtsL [Litorivicinus lipolyticus]
MCGAGVKSLFFEALAVAVGLLTNRHVVSLALMVLVVMGSAIAVNRTTHETRLLYQAQQSQFARIQSLQNERSQLGLEVGALASHARLDAWAREQGFEVASEHEVLSW